MRDEKYKKSYDNNFDVDDDSHMNEYIIWEIDKQKKRDKRRRDKIKKRYKKKEIE